MEHRTVVLRACSRCGAWERVATPTPGAVILGPEPRWSDGFHPHAPGPRAARCPSCRAVHVPTPLAGGPSGPSCLLVLVLSVVASAAAAGSCRQAAIAPLVFVGAFFVSACAAGVVAAVVEALACDVVRRLRARRRRAQPAPEATPDEVIDALRVGLAATAGDELALRRDAWWRWNHHDRALPALLQAEAEGLVAEAGRAAGWRAAARTGPRPRLQAAPAALALVGRPASYAARLDLPARLAEAARAAVARGPGARLEVADLPADLRGPPARPPLPAWWEENLRRLVDLLGATAPGDRLVKAEAARALGDRALARRLLEGEARADEGREVRAWHQLLVEGDDPRVAQVPAAVAAKLPPPEDDCVRC